VATCVIVVLLIFLFGGRLGLFSDRTGGEAEAETIETSLVDSLETVKAEQETASWTPVPENDFDALSRKFVVREKDLKEYYAWLELVILDGNDPDMPYLTDRCKEFVSDANELYWGYDGSIEEAEFKRKWSAKYDLRYADFGHLFENGNGGWMTKELRKVEYLGELNHGEWFRVTIVGGASENDRSQELIRVLKIIRVNGNLLIDNAVRLADGKY